MDNIILEPKADNLVESMRNIGYTFESAVADIIDNSISANAHNIYIKFDPRECHLVFIDDGSGMTNDSLMEAMRWGSKDPLAIRDKFDLGRFGLGLKSASFSQCRKLTVVSSSEGEISSFCWDLDYIRQTSSWSIISVPKSKIMELPYISELLKLNHGTYVLWEKFDKVEVTTKDLVSTLESTLDYTAEYLTLVFHQFLSKGLNIFINNNPLEKIDPFLTKNNFTQHLKTDSVYHKDLNGVKHEIKVEPYVLPHFSKMSQSEKEMLDKFGGFRNKPGFYIYRNNRLIIWGSWFRMMPNNETYKNARVKVEIPNSLDEVWSIDVKKSNATIPTIIKKQLAYAVKNAINGSKRIYTHRAINVNKENGYECVWDTFKENDKTYHKINRDLPIIQSLSEDMSEKQLKILELLLVDIENNIPKYEIFNQIANNDDETMDGYEEAKNRILDLIKTLNIDDKVSFDAVIKPILCSEPYCKYDKLYNELKGCVDSEK